MKTLTVIVAAAIMFTVGTVQANAQDASRVDNSGITFSASRASADSDLNFSKSDNGSSSLSAIAAAAAQQTSSYEAKPASKDHDRRGTSAADMLVGTGVAGSIIAFRRRKP